MKTPYSGGRPEGNHPWLVLTLLSIGQMGTILPGGSFVVALPALLQEFHVGHSEAQLVMTSFIAANTIAMLPTPWLIQRFGMRACFLWAMTILGILSILGYCCSNFTLLVGVRALQGACCGTVLPMGSIITMRRFEPRHQGRASGVMGLVIILGPALAPTIGGFMVDHWGWRSVSLMPLPLCMVAGLFALRYLHDTDKLERHSFDALGMILLSLFTIGWLGMASNLAIGSTLHHWLIASVAVMLLSLVVFTVHVRRHEKPLIGFEVLRHRRVALGAAINFILGFQAWSMAFLVPLYFQVAQGLSASRAGMAMMPGTVALALSYPVAGFLLEYCLPRRVMFWGMTTFIICWFVLARYSVNISYVWFVTIIAISRVGNAFVQAPLTPVSLSGLRPGTLNQAATVVSYCRQLGSIFGIASLSTFIEWLTEWLGDDRGALMLVYAGSFGAMALFSILGLVAIYWLGDIEMGRPIKP